MSVATVSRALSQPELLRPETRERVLSVVAKLGYRPNVLARSLRRGQTHAIVLVVPKLSPFFLEVFAGAEEAAQTAGLAVLLGNSDGKPEREEAYFDQVMSGRADGIILLTGALPPAYADGKRAIPPMVTVFERLAGHDAPVVRIDHRTASAEVTKHLIDLGHRRIAHIAGSRGGGQHGASTRPATKTHSAPPAYRSTRHWWCRARSACRSGRGRDGEASGARGAAHRCVCGQRRDGVRRGEGRARARTFRARGSFHGRLRRPDHGGVLPTRRSRRSTRRAARSGARATQELIEQIAGREVTREIVMPTKLVVRDSTAAPREMKERTGVSAGFKRPQ